MMNAKRIITAKKIFTKVTAWIHPFNYSKFSIVDTDYEYLGSLSWQATTTGKYYATIPISLGGKTMIAATILRFGALAANNDVQPYIYENILRLMSNTNSFSSSARISIRTICMS